MHSALAPLPQRASVTSRHITVTDRAVVVTEEDAKSFTCDFANLIDAGLIRPDAAFDW
jgi:hypothetical protein